MFIVLDLDYYALQLIKTVKKTWWFRGPSPTSIFGSTEQYSIYYLMDLIYFSFLNQSVVTISFTAWAIDKSWMKMKSALLIYQTLSFQHFFIKIPFIWKFVISQLPQQLLFAVQIHCWEFQWQKAGLLAIHFVVHKKTFKNRFYPGWSHVFFYFSENHFLSFIFLYPLYQLLCDWSKNWSGNDVC